MICPLGALSVDVDKRQIIKCNLCEGEPECERICPTGALRYVRTDRVGLEMKRAGLDKLTSMIKPAGAL